MRKTLAFVMLVVSYVAKAVLFFLMLFVTADVVMRYVFNMPIAGDLEIAQAGMAILVFLGISYATWLKAHISIDMFVTRLGTGARAALAVAGNVVGIVAFGFIGWHGVGNAVLAYSRQETTDILKIPAYVLKLVVPVGAFLVCLVLLLYVIDGIARLRKGPEWSHQP